MGIPGLLPQLKSIQHEHHVSFYANKRVAIDAFVWLHQIKHKCAVEIVCNNDYSMFLKMLRSRIDTFKKYNIHVVLVFDGDKLPAKKLIEQERESIRHKNFLRAKELMAQGNLPAANALFGQALEVSPLMAYRALKVAEEKGVECIVAPYEADAQLAYLSRINYVDLVVTEDSDLLAFGAKCVLFKLDINYVGQEIILNEIWEESNFKGWTTDMFLSCCIIAGCDYLSSLKTVGFKTAFGLMVSLGSPRKVLSHLMMEKRYNAPEDYLEKFERAYLTFKFQRVFCPVKQEIVSLVDWDPEELRGQASTLEKFLKNGNRLPSDDFDLSLLAKLWEVESLDFLGAKLPKETALGISKGIINPISKKPYEEEFGSLREFKEIKSAVPPGAVQSRNDTLMPNQTTLTPVGANQGVKAPSLYKLLNSIPEEHSKRPATSSNRASREELVRKTKDSDTLLDLLKLGNKKEDSSQKETKNSFLGKQINMKFPSGSTGAPGKHGQNSKQAVFSFKEPSKPLASKFQNQSNLLPFALENDEDAIDFYSNAFKGTENSKKILEENPPKEKGLFEEFKYTKKRESQTSGPKHANNIKEKDKNDSMLFGGPQKKVHLSQEEDWEELMKKRVGPKAEAISLEFVRNFQRNFTITVLEIFRQNAQKT